MHSPNKTGQSLLSIGTGLDFTLRCLTAGRLPADFYCQPLKAQHCWMAQRDHPARLPGLQATPARTIDHPAARFDLPALETLKRRHIEPGRLIRGNAQHQRTVQFDPDTTAIALHASDLAGHHGKAAFA